VRSGRVYGPPGEGHFRIPFATDLECLEGDCVEFRRSSATLSADDAFLGSPFRLQNPNPDFKQSANLKRQPGHAEELILRAATPIWALLLIVAMLGAYLLASTSAGK
jgi:hypothetical protein